LQGSPASSRKAARCPDGKTPGHHGTKDLGWINALIAAAGAYTTSYSSVGFNGFPPLRQYVI
jgi:hypothetical protein